MHLAGVYRHISSTQYNPFSTDHHSQLFAVQVNQEEDQHDRVGVLAQAQQRSLRRNNPYSHRSALCSLQLFKEKCIHIF